MSTETLQTFSGRRASQETLELRAFISLLKQLGVRSYLEIGAREGDTFHEVMINLPAGAAGVAVDLPGGLWGKGTTKLKLQRAVNDLCTRGYMASCLFGDSKSAGTARTARMRGPFDAVLIDGDHRYEGVKGDWEIYRHFAPVIAFHDIVGEGQAEKVTHCPVEVPRLWEEIKASGLTVREFIAPESKMGIGVILQ